MIVDTHLHVIDQSALGYPWLAGVPALNRNFLYEEYAREAHRVGIGATLHMEVDVAAEDIEAETANVGRLAGQRDNLIVGAISSCRPEAADFPAFLERQQANPVVKGFRRVLHVMPDDLSESAVFRQNIRRLAATRLTFDLCVLPRQMDKAMALVDLAPDVQFVLDHCGVPDIKGGGLDPWREQTTEIAKRSNVLARSPAWSPTPIPIHGRSRICGPMSNTRLRPSAGTASCGAAIGRSARWAVAFPPG